jgi:hypothetical protein
MDHVAKIEVTLTGEAARLYEILSAAVGDSVKPSQTNRAVFETGLVHHVLMLTAVGAVAEQNRSEAEEQIAAISKRTIMRDLFARAREYWQGQSGTGMIRPEG